MCVFGLGKCVWEWVREFATVCLSIFALTVFMILVWALIGTKKFFRIFCSVILRHFLKINIGQNRPLFVKLRPFNYGKTNIFSNLTLNVKSGDNILCSGSLFLQPRPLFHLFSSFQTQITILTATKCEKMSIQYTVLWFKHMTFRTWVSSHNH